MICKYKPTNQNNNSTEINEIGISQEREEREEREEGENNDIESKEDPTIKNERNVKQTTKQTTRQTTSLTNIINKLFNEKFQENFIKTFDWLWKEIMTSGNMPETKKYFCSFTTFKQTKPLTYLFIFIDLILRGISQVYLCDHPISGLLIAIGVGLSSWTLLLHGIIGVIGSTFGATVVCRLPYSKISSGLVGYDGALVGCAIYTFCMTGSNDNSWIYLVNFILSCVSGLLHMSLANILGLAKLPPFTAAFNLTLFFLLLTIAQENTTIIKFRTSNTILDPTTGSNDTSFGWFITMAIKGVGQFMFADTLVGSILVVLGILMQSRRDGFCAVLGAFVGGLTARYIISLPSTSSLAITTGLYGYNAAGTCVVVAGGRFYRATNAAYLLGIIGAALSVYIQVMYSSLFVINDQTSLPVLTFPFITTAWIMMLTQSAWLEVRSDGEEEAENVAPSRAIKKVLSQASHVGVGMMKRVASIRMTPSGRNLDTSTD